VHSQGERIYTSPCPIRIDYFSRVEVRSRNAAVVRVGRQPAMVRARPHLIETVQIDRDHALTALDDPYVPDHVTIQGQLCGSSPK
jgi:hypothetical protein